jgi:surface antigen
MHSRGRNPALSEGNNLRAVLVDLQGIRKALGGHGPATTDIHARLDRVIPTIEQLAAQASRGVHRNPTLAILGNPEGRRGTLGRGSPRGALSETAGLDELILRLYEVANTKSLPESDRKKLEEAGRIAYELWHQARRGVHRNPRKKIARKVLAIDYVHASDGKKYTHDFTEDADHGAVCAYVEDGGRRVVLEASDGKPIVGDY